MRFMSGAFANVKRIAFIFSTLGSVALEAEAFSAITLNSNSGLVFETCSVIFCPKCGVRDAQEF